MFVVAEKYHVISSLGGGGMGAVYEALHSATGRRVAVKMLRQEIASNERQRERFVREARLAGSLASAHVAEVLDAGTDEVSGLPFIVMELLEGPNLREFLQKRGRVPVGLALVIAAHVASGLQEAHEAGVIHRDIKPANVVLCSSRTGDLIAKIVDFGVAKVLEDEEAGLTHTGDLVGSFRYMSPEQLSGEPATAASDIWSLGAVMYEALSGVNPSGDTEAVGVIVRKVCFEDLTPLSSIAPEVPREVADLVQRALSRDPQKRFASAHAMLEAIRTLLPDGIYVPNGVLEDGSQIAVSTTAPTALGHRKAYGIAAAAMALSLTGAIALFASARSTQERQEEIASPIEQPPTPEPAPSTSTAPVELDALPSPPASGNSNPAVPSTAAPADPVKNTKPSARPRAGSASATKTKDPLDHM